ncbi:MAG: DUF1854 domain-containing protein [Limnochordia bacterium]|jgi:hypothetical protein|nr:DUF1854 domain-containing protein [Limnochordia bacterium]MDD2629211.1 DUF1854 domain-containing protein [Limnochordia bacterium]MDD4517646.1 DUF1854 domain-containing protein [Limnochordia bacterium]
MVEWKKVLEDVHFEKNAFLQLICWEKDQSFGPVIVKRPFPLKGPLELVTVASADGQFIGLIHDYRRLDEQSAALIKEALDQRHYMPQILRIVSIGEEGGVWVWNTVTNRGKRRFIVQSRRRDVTWVADNHIVVRDADGNKYEIRDLHKLDDKSKDKIEMEV